MWKNTRVGLGPHESSSNIWSSSEKIMLSYNQRILLRRKWRNVIEKIWKILENHQLTPKHALNVSMIQTHYAKVMNGRFQT